MNCFNVLSIKPAQLIPQKCGQKIAQSPKCLLNCHSGGRGLKGAAAVGVENENETEAKQGRQQMNEALNGERRNSGKMMMMVFCTRKEGGFAIKLQL